MENHLLFLSAKKEIEIDKPDTNVQEASNINNNFRRD